MATASGDWGHRSLAYMGKHIVAGALFKQDRRRAVAQLLGGDLPYPEGSTRYMVLASALGVAGATFFAMRLQKAILQPIEALTAVARELGEGRLDQVVPVESHDELGHLADAFNKMATKLRSYRQVTSAQILQARQMTEITLSAFPDPILGFSAEGRITFTNPAANRLQRSLASNGAELPAAD